MKENVFVGVSGGVDSSVALLRVLRDGHTATAVFIKTWQPDFINCNWERERLDAMRVAAYLNVPFLTCDAEDAYKQDVAEYMIREYREGRTPNPDVMCNQHVKFGVFRQFALAHGATKLATGHYAQVIKNGAIYELHRGVDTHKDQSYFLWTMTQEQLAYTLFPVGDTVKSNVRFEAEQHNLPTFAKQDSQGICFLGQVDIRDFLSHYVPVRDGEIIDEEGNVIGTHEGALMYTIGQRQGLHITPSEPMSMPYYVTKKDLKSNTLTVSKTPKICTGRQVQLSHIHAITGTIPNSCEAQFRYRQKPFQVTLAMTGDACGMLTVHDSDIELPSSGQSCVFYFGTQCLGGGIITDIV